MKVREEPCGAYIVVGLEGDLATDADGALILKADHDYLVRVPHGVNSLPLPGALSRRHGASEASLRFSGFIGRTLLDGRHIQVRSQKLTAEQVEHMLADVSGAFASLPFAFATPVGAHYRRDSDVGSDVAYQAVVLILDALNGRGAHDLMAAVARILANPYAVLRPERGRVDLPLADRLGSGSLVDVVTDGRLTERLPPGHPMAGSPLALRLGGRLPDAVSVERVSPDLDNAENRFVAGVLDACVRLVDVVMAYARTSKAPGAAALASETVVAHEQLRVWRGHRVLPVGTRRAPAPLGSTVLQRQPGYRDVLSFWMDLNARTRSLPPQDTMALLALRDAPTLYEYWCYLEVIRAVGQIGGPPTSVDGVAVDESRARIPWSSAAYFPAGVTVTFNQRFSGRDSLGEGSKSASVPLRPDIVVKVPSGHFHVLDAKFRVAGLSLDGADEAITGEGIAKQADVHKMHAYRDALGARSAWVLYPGAGAAQVYPPQGADFTDGSPEGVGTIPLRPDASVSPELVRVLELMVNVS